MLPPLTTDRTMPHVDRRECGNLLLNALSHGAFEAISPHLERQQFERGDLIVPAGGTIERIAFPEGGIFSVVLASEGRRIEVGIFGLEGMSDGSVLIGIDTVPQETFVQAPGAALTMPVEALVSIAQDWPDVRNLVGRWLHISSLQTAQTALANGGYNVEERLARWILMCQDRLRGETVDVTHDFLGTMLGVQRSTVTLAIHILEGAHLIRARRGHITIRDRDGLHELADGSYGVAESEYERLIGPFRMAA